MMDLRGAKATRLLERQLGDANFEIVVGEVGLLHHRFRHLFVETTVKHPAAIFAAFASTRQRFACAGPASEPERSPAAAVTFVHDSRL
jgi:hypothetical protein